MKITRLELENWMGIPQLALEFGGGVNLLYGRNEIGKSTIIHSIRQALLGDACSKKPEYKTLRPWGTDVKAKVRLSFTAGGNKQYLVSKTFPAGGAELYQGELLLSDEAKKTQERLYKILEISEKTTNLFKLLFIDQGDTLDIFRKGKNPLDENTKSYIKEIIKETAFKEIQEFQDYLQGEMDRYLTTGRDKVKKKTEYFEMLEKENILADEIEELERKEEEIKGKLEIIEKTGKEIAVLAGEIDRKEKVREAMKKKRASLEELRKRELEFRLVQNEYDEYIKIAGEQEEIRQRQPILLATRQQRLTQLKKELDRLESEKKQVRERQEQLKQKKQAGEVLEALKREKADLKKDYDGVCGLEKQSSEIRAELPSLLGQYRGQLERELQDQAKRIRDRAQLEIEKAGIEAKIKALPKIAPGEIEALQKLEKENEKLQAKIESAREKMKLSLRMTPLAGREIPYTMAKDGGEPERGKAAAQVEVSDFQKLEFTYEDHMELQVRGNLTESDIEAMQEKLQKNCRQIEEKLVVYEINKSFLGVQGPAARGAQEVHSDSYSAESSHHSSLITHQSTSRPLVAEGIKDLEQKQRQRSELEARLKSLLEQEQAAGETAKLAEQEKALREQLEKVEQDERKYIKEKPGEPSVPPFAGGEKEEKERGRDPEVRDRLTAAKTKLDSYRQEIDRVLTGRQRTFEQLESLYKQKEAELHRREEEYRAMEPKEIAKVDQELLEKEMARATGIEKGMMAKQEELKLLEACPTDGNNGHPSELNQSFCGDQAPRRGEPISDDSKRYYHSDHGKLHSLIGRPCHGLFQKEPLAAGGEKSDFEAALEMVSEQFEREGQGVMGIVGYTTQQIRDEIIRNYNRGRDLEKRKKDLLGKEGDQEYRMNYIRRKGEIETIKKEMAAVPPEELNEIEKIDVEIERVGKEIKNDLLKKGEREQQRERLGGETADYSRVAAERTGKEGEYRQVMEDIRGGIEEITSLRLLTRLIEEERERAEQEVYRPLQERVHRAFTALVGERYRVGIDKEMNLEISGRTGSGEYIAVEDELLSYGTREQLSFLYRMAIAGQLSRKEPVVMVLDDSFVNTDQKRLPLLLDMLSERAGEMQILVFTCRASDYITHFSARYDKNPRYINLDGLIKTAGQGET